MKILVGVKRVIDHNVKVRVKADGTGVELDNVKMAINPFDETAVEEAVRLKEKGIATEVIAVSIGPDKAEETLRTALAMGADRAILVPFDGVTEPLSVAKTFKALADAEEASLLLLGKQAIDDDCNQTGQMASTLLQWPQATFASKLEIEGGQVTAQREIDGGLETVKMALPAVVTVDLRMNEPRFASLPAIMKAKRKPIERVIAESLSVDLTPRLELVSMCETPARQAEKQIVTNASDLVAQLQAKACI